MSCSRCAGKGLFMLRRVHLGVPGLCFQCDGTGIDPDPNPSPKELLMTSDIAIRAEYHEYVAACRRIQKAAGIRTISYMTFEAWSAHALHHASN